MSTFELKEKHPFWNRVFFALELACVPLALWWIPYTHLPAPGWAVALIAGAAAAMSVHDEMKGWQKGIWLIVIGAFLITELRAISKDREEAQHQAAESRKNQDSAFAEVLKEQNRQFSATAQGFSGTYTKIGGVLKTTQGVAKLAKDSLENLTGGDSVSYLAPQPPNADGSVPLAIVNPGKYPLTGVTLVVEDVTTYPFKIRPAIFVGTMASHVARLIDFSVSPVPGTDPIGVASFQIDIYAQNGTSRQLLQFRKGKKMFWDYRSSLSRESSAPHSMIPKYEKGKSDIPGMNFDYGWIEDRPVPHP